jgi:hypothetical protein
VTREINNTLNTSPWFTQSVQAGGKIVAAVVADVDGAGRAAASFRRELRRVAYSGAFSSFSTFAIRVCAVARAILRAFTRAAAATVLALALVAGLFAAVPDAAATCGISWRLPSTPFMGHEDYRFQLAEKWGDVKISEKRSIPIHVTFSPTGDRSSPILGRDWQFALFDAICVKDTDSSYRMSLPDGNSVRLKKTNNAAVWKNADWIAQVAGRTIIAKSSCGWSLTYYLGRLQQLKTPEGATLGFITDLGRGTRTLKANGKPVLTLRPDFDKTTTQKFWHLNFIDQGSPKHAILKMGKRPFLYKSRDAITKKEEERKSEMDSFVSMKSDGEEERRYNFDVTALNAFGMQYQWDKDSRVLQKKGDESYAFVYIKGVKCLKTTFPDGNITILGANAAGFSVYKSLNGDVELRESMPSRIRPGSMLLRRVAQIDENGRETLLARFWYDENEKPIRKWNKYGNGGIIYEKKGDTIIGKDAQTRRFFSERQFDEKKRLTSLVLIEKRYGFTFLDGGNVKVTMQQGSTMTEKVVTLDQFNSMTKCFEF